MSIFPKETIKVMAEMAGQGPIADDMANAVAADAEYRLREVAQEALKFMRHAKRQKLAVDDVQHALRVKNIEPLYGFYSYEPLKFRRVPQTGGDVYYLQEEEIDCEQLMNAPLPRVPLASSFTSHWLAIEGVQPAIPQNPTPSDSRTGVPIPRLKKEELAAGLSQSADASNPLSSAETEVKPLVKHVLSKELQVYFEKIVGAILQDDETSHTAFLSLRSDTGIQQLVPYFTQFVADKVSRNLKNLSVLHSMMWILRSLLDNQSLFIEPYLHQMMPSVLTCVVGKSLGESPEVDHWKLRDFSASIVSDICSKYGDAYSTLKPRVTKTLLRAFLDPLKSLPTHYGAIVGLGKLGHQIVQILVLPNVKTYMAAIDPFVNGYSADTMKRQEAMKCKDALLSIVRDYFREEILSLPPELRAGHSKSMVVKRPQERSQMEDSDALRQLSPDLRVLYKEMSGIFGEELQLPTLDIVF